MNATTDTSETVLVVTSDRQLLPMSTAGFTVSEGAPRHVASVYVDALVIYRNGTVRKIDRIDFLHYFGKGRLMRLLSFMNGGIRSIAVTMSDVSGFDLQTAKQLILEILQKDEERTALLFDDERPIEERIRTLGDVGGF